MVGVRSTFFLAALALCFHSVRGLSGFALICASYPDVCDHHQYASACLDLGSRGYGYTATSLTSLGSLAAPFHRDTSNTFVDNRRRAIGCDGVTDCNTKVTGLSCDEIPYASTYDGGLGCFSSTYNGNVNSLYNLGSVRCLADSQNKRHGNAVKTFYRKASVGNGEAYILLLSAPTPGTFTANMHQTILNYYAATTQEQRIAAGTQYYTLCNAFAAVAGSKQQRVTRSRYTRAPTCPGRGYRKRSGTDEIDARDLREIKMAYNHTTPTIDDVQDFEQAAAAKKVLLTSGGHHLHTLYGSDVDIDNLKIWVHDEDDVEKGEWHSATDKFSAEHLRQFKV